VGQFEKWHGRLAREITPRLAREITRKMRACHLKLTHYQRAE
jgi:hypothetical protein